MFIGKRKMQKKLLAVSWGLLAAGVGCLLAGHVWAQNLQEGQSLGVVTQSRSAFLFDMDQNEPIFAKQADEVVPLASLTKLMTALVVYKQNPDWDAWIKIEATDRRPGGIPYVITGEEIKREDLWNLMLVASSNESAAALARSTGLDEQAFVTRMNEQARELGLKHLDFADPTGLNPQNQGTAREIAALARVVFSIPKVRSALVRQSYAFSPRNKRKRYIKSTDTLLSSFLNKDPYQVISGKTGYLEESQYNLVFAAAKKDDSTKNEDATTVQRHLIGVVLGSQSNDDRFQEMKGLIYWGFEKAQEVANKPLISKVVF